MPPAKRERSSSTKRKRQRRWTLPRRRKKSCSASTRWTRAVTKCASRRPASHVPPLWVPALGVATSSRSGRGRRITNADRTATYRGAIYFQTTPTRLSRLNKVAVLFEYEVDAEGNTHSEYWEWK